MGRVRDDYRDFEVAYVVAWPKCMIHDLSYPTELVPPGQIVTIMFYIWEEAGNTGRGYYTIRDRDTGKVISVAAGSDPADKEVAVTGYGHYGPFVITTTMPNKTWRLRVATGHIE